MSQVVKLQTRIAFKNKDILKESIGEFGKVSERNETLSLNPTDINRTIEFVKDNGTYIVQADLWMKESAIRGLVSNIESTYQKKAVQTILKKQRFNVQELRPNVLMARRY